jgi:hypothetical protein
MREQIGAGQAVSARKFRLNTILLLDCLGLLSRHSKLQRNSSEGRSFFQSRWQ